MDILDRLYSQLTKIKSILVKEIESGSFTLNYNVCEIECAFLDKSELQKYLTKTPVRNPFFLNEINELCLFIMNTSDTLLKSDRAVEDDFHAFLIYEKRIVEYKNGEDKKHFVKNYDYTFFDLFDIIIECGTILRMINNAHPETIIEKKNPQGKDDLKHPKFNPNLWSEESYKLFKYLVDNYYKGTKRQLTNIWFYLKENNNYLLIATKNEYKMFIKENYGIEIKNFDKAHSRYNDIEAPVMNRHRINFENN